MLFKNIKPRLKVLPILSKHCLGTLVVGNADKLFDGPGCIDALKKILGKNNVICLGEQLHQFPNNSFTLLVALSESHISIHTWPERLTVQLDVFLCNYMNNNTVMCEDIYNSIVEYFETTETNTTILERL